MLTGPVIEPKSGKPRKISILLHGYGSCGDDFAWGLRKLATLFPDTVFVAPNAPAPCENQQRSGTYQWFPITTTALEDYGDIMARSVPILKKFIEQQLERWGLSEEHLVIGGFSQGAMMAIGVGLSLQRPCAGVLAYSGAFTMPEEFKIRSRPKILLVHGKEDKTIPYEMMGRTQQLLTRHSLPVETLSCEGLGHSISLRGFTAGKQFIENIFATQKGRNYGTP